VKSETVVSTVNYSIYFFEWSSLPSFEKQIKSMSKAKIDWASAQQSDDESNDEVDNSPDVESEPIEPKIEPTNTQSTSNRPSSTRSSSNSGKSSFIVIQ
jgi:hypothetical protein